MDLLKNLDNMITAEEFLKDKFRKIYLSHPESFKDKISEKIYLELHVTGRVNGTEQNYPEMMIEFAKLHVTEALKEAFNNSEMRVSENDTNEHPSFTNNYDDGYVTITVSKNSILYAYPLENIK